MNKNLFVTLAFFPLFAGAEAQTIQEAAQEAVISNPEVQLKWHAYQASQSEREVAAGNYYPHVDLQANSSRENHSEPLLQSNYSSRQQSVTLTQMIYDGFATNHEVDRLDHARLVKLYDLYDTTESTTLDVARAHLDVLRYRKLVGLAEDNYVQHRVLYNQILTKAEAGVGRRVDLEQSAGRLALAEANLLSETSNLHDVSARYQRLVGHVPAKLLAEPLGLDQGIPQDLLAALQISSTSNPAILGAIENIRAADSDATGHQSAFQPRVDVRLSGQHGNNINSEIGLTNDKTAQVVLTWNLFNGFSDRAKLHQLADQINVTRDYRDKVCRDLRQTLEIAYNDKHKLTELLKYLDEHQLSIEKARDAYRQQFEIGQRTLLDLLDTENELFQAKRSFVDAQYDQLVALARAQAGMGHLFQALGLSRPDVGKLPKFNDNNGETMSVNCPLEAPQTYVVNKDDLNRRALAQRRELPTSVVPSTGVTVSAIGSAPLSRPANASVQPQSEQLLQAAVEQWRQARQSRDADSYLKLYAPQFKASTDASHEKWIARRQQRITTTKNSVLTITGLQIKLNDATHATTVFHQKYQSESYQDVVIKTLRWELSAGSWRIVSEAPEAY